MNRAFPPASSTSSMPDADADFQEFTALLVEHRPRIMLYLLSIVHHLADAEDLCQRCSVIMWQKFSQFQKERSFLSWACGIAKLEAMNFTRSRVADRHLFKTDVLDLLAISAAELDQSMEESRLNALHHCIQSLPRAEQSFLRRIYWEGSSFEAIANELGCSPKTFYNRMYLLRRRLMACVARRLRVDVQG
ncbi:sigma-70 family RNA polymerase sigma factor [Planctomicrobium sp. SH664]|uniref:sigma-70 family RNA polymerase sigma factor n=1 Tax=Planctomicrobium sp. SH664 TaxID=3448125 RepID=UPI003F5B2C94